MTTTQMKLLAAAMFVLGVLALVVGYMYFHYQAHALPSYLPGATDDPLAHFHRKKRGGLGFIAGLILIFGSIGLAIYAGRQGRQVRSGGDDY